jgi:hypothetical protein
VTLVRYWLLLLASATALGTPAGAADRQGAAVDAPAPAVTGRTFDAYLDVRIALRREAPSLDADVAAAGDLTPLRGRLERWLEPRGLAFEEFAGAHLVVTRDAGLRRRVEDILDQHTSKSGALAAEPDKAPPAGGAILSPQGSPPGASGPPGAPPSGGDAPSR